MKSISHAEDGVWMFPLRSEVNARRLLRAPVTPEQRGLRPVVVSDRQRGVIRVFDAKLSQEVCAAPSPPPPIHSDFTAPSFSSKSLAQSDTHTQLNTCISMLLIDCPLGAAGADTTSSEIWTGWASGHVAVYSLQQGQRTNMSMSERAAPPVQCDVQAILFAHRGAVHALSASSQLQTGLPASGHCCPPRYVFSASYD